MTIKGYDSFQNADGHLVVRDVPIFTECERWCWDEDKQEQVLRVFDRKWLEAAFKKAQVRQRDNYHPPLHIRHHGFGDEVKRAGLFTVTALREIPFKGKRVLAIMADLTITDGQAGDDVVAMRLPYRSVEIHNWRDPGIDSLALLDTEAPFLELPLLAVRPGAPVSPETFSPAVSFTPSRNVGACVGSISQGSRTALLFRANAEEPMDDEDNKDKGEDMAADESGKLDVKAVCKAIESGEISVAEFGEILAAIDKMQGEGGEATEEVGGDEPAAAPTPGDAMAAKADKGDGRDGAVAVQMAAVQGENKALRQRLDAMEEKERTKDDVDAALAKLGNRPLGSDPRAELTAFRKEHGAAAFKAYVDSLHKTLSEDEGDSADPTAALTAGVGKFSDVAMRFQVLGAEAVAKAESMVKNHEVLSRTRSTSLPLDRYVRTGMATLGYHLKD